MGQGLRDLSEILGNRYSRLKSTLADFSPSLEVSSNIASQASANETLSSRLNDTLFV